MAIVCLYCGYFIKKYILLDGSFVDVGVHSQPCKDIYLFATKKNKKKKKFQKKENRLWDRQNCMTSKWGQRPQKDGTTFLTSNQNQGHDGDRL